MASEENRSLKNIEGKKLRRIYFDVPLIFLYSVMLAVPYAILVISWGIGKFDFAEWLSAFRTSVLVCVGFSLPFIILRALNKRFFGRIVCVLAKEGIYYPKGKIRYETIEKIEYAMDSRPKFKSDIAKPFRLIIYTNGGKHIVLSGVPFCAVSKIKACVKGTDIKITGVKSLLSVISAGGGGDNSCCSVLCGVALQCAGYFCRAVCGFCGDMVCARHYTHAHI